MPTLQLLFFVLPLLQFLCKLRPWALHIPMTFSFSCMFSKVWRVHKILGKLIFELFIQMLLLVNNVSVSGDKYKCAGLVIEYKIRK